MTTVTVETTLTIVGLPDNVSVQIDQMPYAGNDRGPTFLRLIARAETEDDARRAIHAALAAVANAAGGD